MSIEKLESNRDKDSVLDILRSMSKQDLDFLLTKYYSNNSMLSRRRFRGVLPSADLINSVLLEKEFLLD